MSQIPCWALGGSSWELPSSDPRARASSAAFLTPCPLKDLSSQPSLSECLVLPSEASPLSAFTNLKMVKNWATHPNFMQHRLKEGRCTSKVTGAEKGRIRNQSCCPVVGSFAPGCSRGIALHVLKGKRDRRREGGQTLKARARAQGSLNQSGQQPAPPLLAPRLPPLLCTSQRNLINPLGLTSL